MIQCAPHGNGTSPGVHGRTAHAGLPSRRGPHGGRPSRPTRQGLPWSPSPPPPQRAQSQVTLYCAETTESTPRPDHCGPGRGRRARMGRARSGCRDPRGRGESAPGDEGAPWCVAGVADQSQRIALPNPVALADLERPVPEVRKDDEMAGVEFDDDDVPRRVRGIGHEVGALRILHPVQCDGHRTVCGDTGGCSQL